MNRAKVLAPLVVLWSLSIGWESASSAETAKFRRPQNEIIEFSFDRAQMAKLGKESFENYRGSFAVESVKPALKDYDFKHPVFGAVTGRDCNDMETKAITIIYPEISGSGYYHAEALLLPDSSLKAASFGGSSSPYEEHVEVFRRPECCGDECE